MKIVKHVLLSITSLLFLLEPVLVSVIRNKRVLYGHTANEGHRDAYDSFRYYVFLSTSEPPWIWYALARGPPNLQDLVCGGGLLTPSIVQTAAHCISRFSRVEEDEEGNNVTYFHAMNVWENPRYAYVGSNLITRTGHWLKPKTYIIYLTTRVYQGTALGVLFDYGLVLTETTIVRTAPNAAISYAPVYTGLSIAQFHSTALNEELMCLQIGHGFWNVILGEQGLHTAPSHSDAVRWGWRTIMNAVDCASVVYDQRERRRFNFNYDDYATWVCAQSFRRYPKTYDARLGAGGGDSGGPVTCNNVYFAIGSGVSGLPSVNIIDYFAPIVHTMFENSAEYRDQFIDYHSGVVWPIPGQLGPTNQHLSKSPPKPHVHYLLVLPTTTFFILLS